LLLLEVGVVVVCNQAPQEALVEVVRVDTENLLLKPWRLELRTP
jgi:hypothetical protein